MKESAATETGSTLEKIKRSYHQDDFEGWPRPSKLELARLAAQLARTEKIDPKQLVSEAWNIYRESCRRVEQDRRELERANAMAAEKAREDSRIPRPEKYPVTFGEVEVLLLPKLKGRTAERAALFREHIFAGMVAEQFSDSEAGCSYWDCSTNDLAEMRDQASDEVSRVFAEQRAAKYHANDYMQFARSFLSWYGGYSELRNSEAKAANALKGWEKRRTAKARKTGARPKISLLKKIIEGK